MTDDIYEQMIYEGSPEGKHLLPGLDRTNVLVEEAGFSKEDCAKMADKFIIMNSVGFLCEFRRGNDGPPLSLGQFSSFFSPFFRRAALPVAFLF